MSSLLHMSEWVSKKARGQAKRSSTSNKATTAAASEPPVEDGLESAAIDEASQTMSQMENSQVELLEDSSLIALEIASSAVIEPPAVSAAAAPPFPSPLYATIAAASTPIIVTAIQPAPEIADNTLEEQMRNMLDGVEVEIGAQQTQLKPQPAASIISSHLQQAAERVFTSKLSNASEIRQCAELAAQPNQEQKQAGAEATAAEKRVLSSNSSSLPLATPLLIAHVLDDLLSSNHSTRFTDSMLRGLGHKLGHAVKRSETIRQRKDTLLQQDMHTAAASIQKVMCKILSTARDANEIRSVSIFLESLGRACPPLIMWCGLRQLDAIIAVICNGSAEGGGAATSAVSELAGIDRLDLMERACLLCQLMERILESVDGIASSSSAYTMMLSAFGLDWHELWKARFSNSINGHLLSGDLAVIAPMLLAYLWQLFERMQPLQQICTIDAMQSRMDEK